MQGRMTELLSLAGYAEYLRRARRERVAKRSDTSSWTESNAASDMQAVRERPGALREREHSESCAEVVKGEQPETLGAAYPDSTTLCSTVRCLSCCRFQKTACQAQAQCHAMLRLDNAGLQCRSQVLQAEVTSLRPAPCLLCHSPSIVSSLLPLDSAVTQIQKRLCAPFSSEKNITCSLSRCQCSVSRFCIWLLSRWRLERFRIGTKAKLRTPQDLFRHASMS